MAPTLQTNDIRAFWSHGKQLWGVGTAGTILRFDGRSWAIEPSGTNETLTDVWGSGPSDIFAVGEQGLVLRYDGSTWKAHDRVDLGLNAIWGSGPTDVFAVGLQGFIQHYDGQRWSTQRIGPNKFDSTNSDALTDLWGSGPNNVFAVGGRGMILHYNGKRWQQQKSGTDRALAAIWGSAKDNVFAVGNRVTLRFNGRTWSPMDSAPKAYLLDVWGSGADQVFAVGKPDSYGSKPVVSLFDRTTWHKRQKGITWPVNAVVGTAGGTVYAGGRSGGIARLDGSSWMALSRVITERVYKLWGSSAHDVYALARGKIFHFDGCGWSPVHIPTKNGINGVWGSGPRDVHAVGSGGTALRYDGRSWKMIHTPTAETLLSVWAAGPKTAFAVGKRGTVLRFNGTAWSAIPSPGKISFKSVTGYSANNVVAWGYGERGAKKKHQLWRYNGSGWTELGAPDTPISGIWVGPRVVVILAGESFEGNERILRYDGKTWQRQKLRPDDEYAYAHAIWGRAHDDLYAAGSPGEVFHYDGRSWASRRIGVKKGAVSLWGTKSTLFLGGDKGVLVRIPAKLWKERQTAAPPANVVTVRAVRKPPEWPAAGGCHNPCMTDKGEPGVRCSEHSVCGNPCLPGMAVDNGYCSRLCKSDKDCVGMVCGSKGVCTMPDRPKLETCRDGSEPGSCTTKKGQAGWGCPEQCEKACRGRLILTGGTHCAKPCRSDRDCPKGSCNTDHCSPLCPMEGCPYLWD